MHISTIQYLIAHDDASICSRFFQKSAQTLRISMTITRFDQKTDILPLFRKRLRESLDYRKGVFSVKIRVKIETSQEHESFCIYVEIDTLQTAVTNFAQRKWNTDHWLICHASESFAHKLRGDKDLVDQFD